MPCASLPLFLPLVLRALRALSLLLLLLLLSSLQGVKPARRISAVATALLYSFAVAFPFLHNYVMANIGL